jgi:alkaline phosphatase
MKRPAIFLLLGALTGVITPAFLGAHPVVKRLTPPSGLFSYGDPAPPIISRFLPGQRFDLQATLQPDPGQSIVGVEFRVDGTPVEGPVSLTLATADSVAPGTMVATRRAASRMLPGIRILTVRALQSDGAIATATGNFEIVALKTETGAKARNIILMIGDGMGIAHRTAARLMLHGVTQGKSFGALAMETFPATAMVKTASLNSLLTDSSPGASAYSTGNKANNGHVGIFPDDTKSRFDNPRVELMGEYFARTQGKWLGIVTTSDVADATPSAFAAHCQESVRSCGIVDGYLDEAVVRSNLRVVLGGGRGTFLPHTTPGSSRSADYDFELPPELATAWGIPPGKVDPERNLLADFRAAGFSYVASRSQLAGVPAQTSHMLGLFTFGHMNSALDKIAKRRGRASIVDDFGFPDQPMLEEMTGAALTVLKQNAAGFVLLIEGALIDKNSHTMDAERWIHDVIEFDRAVARAKAFAQAVPDTLVIVTADHETGGVNVIGSSRVTQADLARRAVLAGGAKVLREEVVQHFTTGGFPTYAILADGYPDTTDVDRRMLIGYAANADRHEDWLMNPKQTGGPAGSPGTPLERDTAGGFLIIGQVPGWFAGHTGSDVPLSAFGVGASSFSGVLDNTEVCFRIAQLAIGGAAAIPAPQVAAGVRQSPTQRTATDRLINLSSRAAVGTGGDAMINGFVLTGDVPHRLLLRGVGPSLVLVGISNALHDPMIELRNAAGALVDANDNWESNDNVSAIRDTSVQVGAFPLTPGSRDAALLISLPAGSYSVKLFGADGGSGLGLLEIYELP